MFVSGVALLAAGATLVAGASVGWAIIAAGACLFLFGLAEIA